MVRFFKEKGLSGSWRACKRNNYDKETKELFLSAEDVERNGEISSDFILVQKPVW